MSKNNSHPKFSEMLKTARESFLIVLFQKEEEGKDSQIEQIYTYYKEGAYNRGDLI
tara:strand:+ start:1116 stop:1283 length:168 start_codon:yes stop_codon:yes gene_type:complete